MVNVPPWYAMESGAEKKEKLRYGAAMATTWNRVAGASKRAGFPRARWAFGLLALLALALPRLLPAAPMTALDARPPAGPVAGPVETAADNFPGSAFFYAEGAFQQEPQAAAEPAAPHILPLVRVVGVSAQPFVGATSLDRARALNCLTNAIYYEAANEPEEGQRAVAQVVLNRVRHPLWPSSVCGVVYQGAERADLRCQFTFACDGSMARFPVADKWARARAVAARALAGEVFAPVGHATYYHTLAVRPDWRLTLEPVAVVGAHIFYEMRGARGSAQAFSIAYTGREPLSGPPPSSYLPRARTLPAPPVMPVDIPAYTLPTPVPTPAWNAAPIPENRGADRLPQSTIRPEYRNSGRPLI